MEEEQEDPAPEDISGRNGVYAQSVAILHNGLNSMMSKLNSINLTAGNGVSIQGAFPMFVISVGTKSRTVVESPATLSYPLQPVFVSSSIRFLPGLVEVYNGGAGFLDVYPTIGGVSVNDIPSPTLPIIPAGAIIYLKHTFTWNGDGTVTTTSVELVQYGFGITPTNIKNSSSGAGTASVSGNVVYIFMSSYNQNQTIVRDSTGIAYNGAEYATKSVRQGNTVNFLAPSATFTT